MARRDAHGRARHDRRDAIDGHCGTRRHLVVAQPTAFEAIEVGDIVSYVAPGSHSTYTHRVTARTPDALTTQGDIASTPDPWSVRASDVVGRVDVVIPYLGWLVRALPILLLGWMAVWGAARLVAARPERAAAVRIVGVPLVVALAVVVLQPLVGVVAIGQILDERGTSLQQFVSTGILPIEVQGVRSGASTHVRTGEVGSLPIIDPDARGRVLFSASPSLDWVWWIVIGGICLLPTLAAFRVRIAPREEFAA